MNWEPSVKHKILLSLWLSAFLLLALVGALASAWFTQDQASRLDDFLTRETRAVQETLTTYFAINNGEGPEVDSVTNPEFKEVVSRYLGERVNRPFPYKTTLGIFGPQGNLVQASNFALNLSVAPHLDPDADFQLTTVTGDPAYRLAEMPLLHNGRNLGSVRLACLTVTLVEVWNSFLITLLMVLGLAFVSFGSLGTFLIQWSMGPIRKMSLSARDISESHLERRLMLPPGNDELAQMAGTINQLLSRLESDFEFEKTLVGQLSHELRTPLAILRGRNEVSLERLPASGLGFRNVLEDNIADIDHMVSLLNTLLRLARLDGRIDTIAAEPCDLSSLLPDLLEELEPLWEEKHLHFELVLPGRVGTWSLSPAVTILGDPVLLRQVFLNLLTNAFKYTPADGTITLSIEDSSSTQEWVITLRNPGPPIPTESLELIFKRFYRLESQHPDWYEKKSGMTQRGFGLGLSIARTLVDLHKGSIRAFNPVGGGAAFEVRLPR